MQSGVSDIYQELTQQPVEEPVEEQKLYIPPGRFQHYRNNSTTDYNISPIEMLQRPKTAVLIQNSNGIQAKSNFKKWGDSSAKFSYDKVAIQRRRSTATEVRNQTALKPQQLFYYPQDQTVGTDFTSNIDGRLQSVSSMPAPMMDFRINPRHIRIVKLSSNFTPTDSKPKASAAYFNAFYKYQKLSSKDKKFFNSHGTP